MKKSTIIVLVSVAVVVLCALCFVLNMTKVKTGEWYAVSLNGKAVAVSLDANPTTGCQWQVEVSGAGVSHSSQKYRSNTTVKNGIVGAGGIWKARYSGFRKGETVLVFRYLQPWYPENVYDKKTIVVEAGSFGRIKSITTY